MRIFSSPIKYFVLQLEYPSYIDWAENAALGTYDVDTLDPPRAAYNILRLRECRSSSVGLHDARSCVRESCVWACTCVWHAVCVRRRRSDFDLRFEFDIAALPGSTEKLSLGDPGCNLQVTVTLHFILSLLRVKQLTSWFHCCSYLFRRVLLLDCCPPSTHHDNIVGRRRGAVLAIFNQGYLSEGKMSIILSYNMFKTVVENPKCFYR